MKKALLIVTLAAGMVACKQKPADQTKDASYQDTVGLADYQKWQRMNEIKEANEYFDKQEQAAAPKTKTVYRTVNSPAQTSTASTNTTAAPAKKGWSKGAKGAVIGTATGAAAGALINKRNRLVGGVVGGAVGAGLGYVIGNDQDKKDGRK